MLEQVLLTGLRASPERLLNIMVMRCAEQTKLPVTKCKKRLIRLTSCCRYTGVDTQTPFLHCDLETLALQSAGSRSLVCIECFIQG